MRFILTHYTQQQVSSHHRPLLLHEDGIGCGIACELQQRLSLVCRFTRVVVFLVFPVVVAECLHLSFGVLDAYGHLVDQSLAGFRVIVEHLYHVVIISP